MIRVVNLHNAYRINETYVRNLAFKILRMVRTAPSIDLEFIFLNNRSIRAYNKRYRSKDRATDVLSFGLDRREFGEKGLLGEIMISLDAALKNSRRYGTAFANEIVLYMIHGILHLCGYDDSSVEGRRRMTDGQDLILDRLCSSRVLSRVLMPR